MAVNKNYYNSLKEYIKFPDFIKSNLGIRFLGIIFLTFILLVTTISNIKITPVSLSVEVVSPQYDDIFQVFYDIGKGYNETDSIKAKVTRNNRLTKIVFNLPDKDTNKLRIDTGTQKGHIVIKAIRLKQYFRIFNITTSYIKRWPAKEIIEDFKPINHIVNFYEKNGMLHITATGENPYIQIDNISPIKDLSLILRIVISFLAILFVIVVFYVSKFIYDKFILIKNRILCL
ncbi:MAG: hypothetical protein SVR08_18080, partial [Spirochaetota bacterium]|nr:hypothetical protein [Spirochaetota bacterium]